MARHPLRIHGAIHYSTGSKLEKNKATVEVIGERPNNLPYVSICNDRNQVVASIDAAQMNGLVRRWMKANGWDWFRNDVGEVYQKIVPPSKRRKK